jgi:hypothetical protein
LGFDFPNFLCVFPSSNFRNLGSNVSAAISVGPRNWWFSGKPELRRRCTHDTCVSSSFDYRYILYTTDITQCWYSVHSRGPYKIHQDTVISHYPFHGPRTHPHKLPRGQNLSPGCLANCSVRAKFTSCLCFSDQRCPNL